MKTSITSALLVLSISHALAANVVHLTIQKGTAPAQLRRRGGVGSRSTITENLSNNLTAGAYLASVEVGTPGQKLSLVIDTGSSDIFVVSSTADECNSPTLEEEDGPCTGGTFDMTASSTFDDILPGAFQIEYQDQSGSSGDYFTDTFTIDGTSITKLQMGLALNLTTESGVMGIGYKSGEAAVQSSGQYPNLVDQMVAQGKINRKVYSLYLDDLDSSTGSILFGGIDTKKFDGDLKVVDVQPDGDAGGGIDAFIVALTSMSITDDSGSTTSLFPGTSSSASSSSSSSSSSSIDVTLDSGTTIAYVPSSVLSGIITALNGDTRGRDTVIVDCSLRNTKTFISFGFGGSGGPVIKVPIEEVILDLDSSGFASQETCTLGIKSSSPPYLLGDTFLRSAYVVYDLDHNQIGLAQTNFGDSASNIVEISADSTGIPTTLSGATGGQTSAPTASGSGKTSKAAAVQAVPAFESSGLVVLGVSIFFAVMGGVGFMV